ncbi:MAG TPA: 4'-phosphopantetheinyl transferase superfamily protein [Symbiobacteriaceae bacterium]|nr:4'-phosphopantetheinyl transferase superfamily protein [Symbiobacteriaceae bacterium]
MVPVTVHRIFLEEPEYITHRLALCLSPDEQARAERFRFERDRRSYTVARAAMRQILAAALGLPAAAVAFRYGPHGKPQLADPGLDLQFNLSHSGSWALCAVVRGRAVGVDIEYMRTIREFEALANRFYSPRESALLKQMPEAQRPAAFYRAWTSKEAYVKALGAGLTLDTRVVDVRLRPDEPAGLLAVRGDSAEAARWSLTALTPPAPGYAAALCVEGADAIVRVADWEP